MKISDLHKQADLTIILQLQRPQGVGGPGGGSPEVVRVGAGGRPQARVPGWWGEPQCRPDGWDVCVFTTYI